MPPLALFTSCGTRYVNCWCGLFVWSVGGQGPVLVPCARSYSTLYTPTPSLLHTAGHERPSAQPDPGVFGGWCALSCPRRGLRSHSTARGRDRGPEDPPGCGPTAGVADSVVHCKCGHHVDRTGALARKEIDRGAWKGSRGVRVCANVFVQDTTRPAPW